MAHARRHDELEGRIDLRLLLPIIALVALGVVMVASSSIALAEAQTSDPWYYLNRHLVFLAVGVSAGWLFTRVELSRLEAVGQGWLWLSLLLLLVVFMPGLGRTVNGATRWINLGFFGFQAVEAVKLALVLYLAGYMVRQGHAVMLSFAGAMKPIIAVVLMLALLLLQPDFGSAVLLVAITIGMVWLAGARLRYLGLLGVFLLPGLAWAALSESYRLKRLISFMDPWKDPFADGFQLTQALIAIGRGEWFGVGLGGSVQKLFYLPEAHTDFILAVLAEELGFAGLLAVIGLFAWLTARAFFVGFRCLQLGLRFAGYCAFGVALWIATQSMFSIGVNMGLLPTKGLTLPLISSGGSSLIMTCAALGLLLRCSRELDRAERKGAVASAEAEGEGDSGAEFEREVPA
jgi:cell division protein FtsW